MDTDEDRKLMVCRSCGNTYDYDYFGEENLLKAAGKALADGEYSTLPLRSRKGSLFPDALILISTGTPTVLRRLSSSKIQTKSCHCTKSISNSKRPVR